MKNVFQGKSYAYAFHFSFVQVLKRTLESCKIMIGIQTMFFEDENKKCYWKHK